MTPALRVNRRLSTGAPAALLLGSESEADPSTGVPKVTCEGHAMGTDLTKIPKTCDIFREHQAQAAGCIDPQTAFAVSPRKCD